MRTRPSIFETGIPGLDTILGGGLSRDALIFLMGMSGSGKTLLGTQLLFNAARRGERGLMLTGFSEGHVKLLQHLAAFSFFDQAFVGNELTLLSLQTLIGSDIDTAAALLIRTARQTGARFILIDGLQTLRALLRSQEDVMLLLAALANQLTYLGVTLIVTVDGPPQQVHALPETIMADIAISLDYSTEGWRRVRRLEVVKHRGHAQLNGSHSFLIASSGIMLYPRLETLCIPVTMSRAWTSMPLGFGLPELDSILTGGLASGTSTIVAGPPGAGKTALALAWAISVAAPTTPALFISFSETSERLQQRAESYGLDVQAAIAEHGLTFMYVSPANVDPDQVGNQLLSTLQASSIRRVIIDDLNVLAGRLEGRTHDYLAALCEWFKHLDVTAIFVLETSTNDYLSVDFHQTPYLVLAENIIALHQQMVDQRLRRVLAVQKTALKTSGNTLCELVLDNDGLRVLRASESASRAIRITADDSDGTMNDQPQPS